MTKTVFQRDRLTTFAYHLDIVPKVDAIKDILVFELFQPLVTDEFLIGEYDFDSKVR